MLSNSFYRFDLVANVKASLMAFAPEQHSRDALTICALATCTDATSDTLVHFNHCQMRPFDENSI
jgi:hypothetical protein